MADLTTCGSYIFLDKVKMTPKKSPMLSCKLIMCSIREETRGDVGHDRPEMHYELCVKLLQESLLLLAVTVN